MKICTIHNEQKMLRDVNPYVNPDPEEYMPGNNYTKKQQDNYWKAQLKWDSFEKTVKPEICDIPDLKEGDTIEDWECKLQWQKLLNGVWEEAGEINMFSDETRQAYVRKEGVREEEDITRLHEEWRKTADLNFFEWFKQQGYTITKKI